MSLFAAFSRLALLTWPVVPEGDDGYWAPPFDLYETASDLVVELELPGTAPGDVRVTCDGDTLVVEGSKEESVPRGLPAVGRFLCVERASGPFRRLVRLPGTVDPGRASARFGDGVLTVTFPKLRL